MASWTVANGTTYITITRDAQSFQVSKFATIVMTVDEPILFFRYSDNNPHIVALRSDNRQKTSINTRLLEIDFNDVTSPVEASATALMAQINVWLAVTGGAAIADGDYGDITVSGAGSAMTIDNDVVTFVKTQNIATNKLLGRGTAGTGDIEEITLGTNLSLSGTTLNATGGTVTSVSGTANRITSTGGATPVIDISATFEALLGKVADPLSQFAATTSAQLAGVISDETGTNKLVFSDSPTLVTPLLGTPTSGVLTNTTGYKLSSLSPATTGNSIDNNGNGQVWNFTGLAGTDALKLSSTSTAAASNASTVLNITTDGTNATSSQTTYGAQILNNHIGTSATSIGLLVTAKEAETVYALKAVATNGGLGDPATSIAGYFSASGGTSQNSAIIVPASGGNVGIGTSSPGASSLHIVSAPTNGEYRCWLVYQVPGF